jgi:hypothetical protein
VSTTSLAPDCILQSHVAHWKNVRRHAQHQFSANLLRHRARLQALLAVDGGALASPR